MRSVLRDVPSVVAALYNAAVPDGLRFEEYDFTPMTREAAERLILDRSDGAWIADGRCRVWVVKGRDIRLVIEGDRVDTSGYAFAQRCADLHIRALDELALSGRPDCPAILAIHAERMREAVVKARPLIAAEAAKRGLVGGGDLESRLESALLCAMSAARNGVT